MSQASIAKSLEPTTRYTRSNMALDVAVKRYVRAKRQPFDPEDPERFYRAYEGLMAAIDEVVEATNAWHEAAGRDDRTDKKTITRMTMDWMQTEYERVTA